MKKALIFLFAFYLLTSYSLYSQWYKQTIPVSKPITGIEFTDSLKGWACTSRGSSNYRSYILYTTNGGTNWFVQHDSVEYNFYALDMVNDSVGYVVGSSLVNTWGLLLKTTNGGVNWINLDINVGLIIEDVFFPSKDTGYICSSNSFAPGLWRTTNGGLSWQVSVNGLPSTLVKTLFFLNNQTGRCGTGQFICKTSDGGSSWSSIGTFSEGSRSIYFLNDGTGWLGFDGDKIRFTSNGGINWILQPNPQFQTVTDIYFSNQFTGYAGISYIYIYKTTDGGNNWGYQRDSTGSFKFSFLNSNEGWTGDFGVSYTNNGGGPITYLGIVSNHNNIPNSYVLYQNYPNPFNSQTKIKFALRKSGYVKLKIYDVLGREKTIWESGNILGAGTHELSFNAENFSSGVYFYRLTIINEQLTVVYKETRKMILLK